LAEDGVECDDCRDVEVREEVGDLAAVRASEDPVLVLQGYSIEGVERVDGAAKRAPVTVDVFVGDLRSRLIGPTVDDSHDA
jgi:hypothetical protein